MYVFSAGSFVFLLFSVKSSEHENVPPELPVNSQEELQDGGRHYGIVYNQRFIYFFKKNTGA